MDQLLILKLVIAYTLVGAFVFTVIVTCLSVVGWVKLADDSQQRRLFTILIVELVVGCVAWFFQFIALDPGAIAKEIGQRAVSRAEEGMIKVLQDKEAEYAKQAQQLKAKADQKSKDLAAALAGANSRIGSLQAQVSGLDARRAKLVADRDAAPTAAERKKLQEQIDALDREKKALVAKVDANECLVLAVPEAVIGPQVQRR